MWRIPFPTTILRGAILISVISVVSFTYQLIFSQNHKTDHTRSFDISAFQKSVFKIDKDPISIVLKTPVTTTLNPRMRVKLNMIHRHLNDTTIVNNTLFPALKTGKFLLINPTICKDTSFVDIVVIVHTAPRHLDNRQRIRDSFGKKESFFPFQVRVAFLLGTTLDPKLESVLMMEQTRHGDLVMGEFIDDYHNLTLKGVMGYRWVSEYCPNSKHVLKIDDDVLINMYKLLYQFLNHMHGKSKSIFCNVWYNNSMPILRQGKWKVPSNMFSKMTVFPYDYCSGFVVLMTSDLMAPMYEAAKKTPFFWIDDVYLFGILPSIVGGVTYYNYRLDKNMTLNDKVAINCTRDMGAQCPIFATIISQPAYWNLWGMIQRIYSFKSWDAAKKVVDGFVVLMTSDLMAPLYEAAKKTPFFWIDDVYLFGILPSMVGGVTYYNYRLDKNMTLNDKVAINCTRDMGAQCPIFATIISQPAYWNLWGMIQRIYSFKSWDAAKKVVE